MISPGKVFLVGAGPGDSGLITRRGSDLIESSDAIVVDALVNPALLRTQQTKKIFYVGKRGPGAPRGASVQLKQEKINALLVRLAKQGLRVIRLKGGDPFVFGRGSEEVSALLRAHVSFEIVPGVSSAIAVPAYAGIPITDRDFSSQVTFITGHERGDRESTQINLMNLPRQGTVVVLMGVSSWKRLQENFLKRGWDSKTHVCAIENGTLPSQRTISTTLGASSIDFQKAGLKAPSVIVVGNVSSRAKRFEWFQKSKPLLGKRIVVTRGVHQNQNFVSLLEEQGAEVVICPSIRVVPLLESSDVERMIETIRQKKGHYDGVIFLSANAVRIFSRLFPKNLKIFQKTKICAVGPQTAEALRQLGWPVTVTAKTFNAQGIFSAVKNMKVRRWLVPRVQNGPDQFLVSLRKTGAFVDDVAIYKTLNAPPPSKEVKKAILSGVDVITFTSASTVKGFVSFFSALERQRIFNASVALSIGPSTSVALRNAGVRHVLQAKEATIPGMMQVLLKGHRKR